MMKDEIFEAIKDRWEGWELAEVLNLPIEDILLEFEEEILEKIEDIKELLGIEEEDNDNND